MASLSTYLSLLSSSLSLVFLLLLRWRLCELNKQKIKVKPGGWRGFFKLVSAVLLACVQVLTAFLTTSQSQPSHVYILVTGLPPIAAFSLVFLSFTEHRRSIRPSSLILVYVLASLLCDLIQLTVPSLGSLANSKRLGLTLQLTAKAIALCAESLGKGPDLFGEWRGLPPEETASIFDRSLMWWMNTILARGYRNTLINDELPEIDHALSSLVLRERILHVWAQSDSPWLLSVLVKCLLRPGLVIAVWRTSLIVFRYGQPVLISYAIAFLNNPNSTKDDGYFVVVAAIVVHIGIAFNSRAYQQGISRLRVMVRGSLVGLVHENSLIAPSEANESGTPVALVTTDVATLENAVETFYTTWACSIEAIIGTFLLAKQVGWIWPVPHLITIFCSRISAYVARNLKHRVREWNAATRKRVSMTASVLSSAKTIKMLGMQQAVEQQLLDLRHEEMDKAASVRWIRVIYNASANALGLFAPVITIVLYAIVAALKGTSLDPETAFPAVATISLVTHGANMVMTIIPKAVAAYPSFERIQSYLQPAGLGNRVLSFVPRSHDVQFAILIKDLYVSWKSGQKALSGISLGVSKGTIVACSGPVGSGKTTLARVILGETFPTLSGVVKVSANRLAYCAQTSWLPNRTVREVIHGPNTESTADESWYRTVVNACCLDQDLATLPDEDGTLVGDGGMNLSGGQRQRVALARAVFQRYEVAVLDDIFSALDGRTEKHVAENLFGAQGLFRKLGTTVFWITSSTQHFHMADYVVVLDAGRIQEQGPWSELKASEQQISKLIHENDEAGQGESSKAASQPQPAPIATEETRRGDGDSSLYGYYFASAGIRNIIFLVFCTASSGLFVTLPQYWLKFWTLDSGGHTAFYASGYAVLYLIAWLSTNGNMWSTLLWIAPTSSIVFHQRLLKTVICAPLVYFSTTDTGIILNHFSQDLDLVDRYIASAFASFSSQVFKVIFQISVIFAVQPVMSLTLPVCIAVIYVVQRVYLRTSRQMRIIELESRSAVFSSLLETARGVETIRAFGWQHEMAVENMHVLDLSQRPFYLLFCLTRWLGVVLNLLGGGIAVGIILLAVVLKGTTTGAQVGVALNVILVTKTTLISLVDYYTTLEISLGAVTRLKKVDKDTPQETDEPTEKLVDDSWPTRGRLELKSVSASYNQGSLALLDVGVKIAAGETVAVCGRTGSGKSSLILTLLRLLNLESGSIIVDGVDISRVPLAVLRQRCFVTIAQDPFFLHAASLRFNLDPSGLLSNQELVRILEKVGLWTHLVNSTNSVHGEGSTSSQSKTTSHDDQTPLLATNNKSYDIDADAIFNRPLSSLPTLSGGQAQLLALARGIAQCQHPLIINEQYEHNSNPKPIILLDEITSSLDAVTEATVCDIVQEEFVNKGHTVVMVTHKLGPFLAARRRIIEAVEQEAGSRCGKGLTVLWMKDGRVENVERDVQTIGV